MTGKAYDVLILGGGNAGFGVTVPTREAGMKVALVEERDLGGSCPNRGCTPKKVLVAAGHALHEIERAKVHCISVDKPKLDWCALIDREKDLIKGIPDSLGQTLEQRGVDLFRGAAKFIDPNVVQVGSAVIEAKHIVIATGSRPRPLPIPGAELMITSDEVLSDRTRPSSVVFVGGGVIALELGHVYARAGTNVTILEVLPRLLPALDEDAVAQIKAESESIGIKVHTGVKVKRVETRGNRLRTIFEAEGEDRSIESDHVVNGAGRIANVDALDLEVGKVAHDGFRIKVDEYLRSLTNIRSMSVATPYRDRRSSHPLRPMRAGSSAAILLRVRNTSPTIPISPPRFTQCLRLRALGSPRRKPGKRESKSRSPLATWKNGFRRGSTRRRGLGPR
jgi:glutathione reductase (NADPH)